MVFPQIKNTADGKKEVAGVIFQTPTPFLMQNFWIRIRFLVWIFKFENQTHVQTPDTIDPTEIYQCFCLRNDNADSCCCLNWKVTQVLVSGPESNKTQHIFKPWMGSEIRFKIYWSSFSNLFVCFWPQRNHKMNVCRDLKEIMWFAQMLIYETGNSGLSYFAIHIRSWFLKRSPSPSIVQKL